MVRVAMDIDPVQFDQVSIAVAKYGYSSVQQFLIAAAWNQVALHETDQRELEPGVSPTGGSGEAGQTPKQAAAGPEYRAWRPLVGRVERAKLHSLLPVEPYGGAGALLWGQTNRVLPVAVGVRVLANMLATAGDESVKLDDWHHRATKVAQALRAQLKLWDAAAGRGRSDQWATALPTEDAGSANRFMGQFLGWPRRDGKIAEGGAIWLGFVGFADAQSNAVSLTEAGASWADLTNPIFDGDAPSATFSEGETKFFIDHLRENRPTEFGLLADVAKLVQSGKSRVEIDTDLEGLYPEWARHSATMRAGALGRLSDLGLLTRERHGLTVSYHLAPLADAIGLAQDAPGAA